MKIYVLSTLEIGMDITNTLKSNLQLAGIIGLSHRDPEDTISGYTYLKSYCDENEFDFVEVGSYSLNDPSDKERLLNIEIDILVVSGWQRLIPAWLIAHCRVCVIGSHGSTRGITGGRGRSPQNWALLLGMKEFYISIFKIDAGVDSGDVIDTRKYVVSEFDDIKTSYYKVCWLTAHMIVEAIKTGNILTANLEAQVEEPRYLPQRLPADGEIDWSRSSSQVYDFIRALTKPYPGAFSFINGKRLTIWRSRPFEIPAFSSGLKCGEIAKMFANGDFLVKTGDSFLLVEEYATEPEDTGFTLEEGTVLSSADFRFQLQHIVKRHYDKYPDLKISDDILGLST